MGLLRRAIGLIRERQQLYAHRRAEGYRSILPQAAWETWKFFCEVKARNGKHSPERRIRDLAAKHTKRRVRRLELDLNSTIFL